MKRKTCTNHCRTCDRHFHSTPAFDLHRAFRDPDVEDWATRICLDPEHDLDRMLRSDGEPRLQPYTTEGYCEIQTSEVQHPVTIWQQYDRRGDPHDRIKAAVGAGSPADRDSEGGNIQDQAEASDGR